MNAGYICIILVTCLLLGMDLKCGLLFALPIIASYVALCLPSRAQILPTAICSRTKYLTYLTPICNHQ